MPSKKICSRCGFERPAKCFHKYQYRKPRGLCMFCLFDIYPHRGTKTEIIYGIHLSQKYADKRQQRLRMSKFHHTRSEFIELCHLYCGRCLSCGKSGVELVADHVIPVSVYPDDSISNIQPLCHHCNNVKHDKTIDFRMEFT